MIYRPVPITEAKASTIDERLKSKILAERKARVLPCASSDSGFIPAEGRREAIRRQVDYLQKLHACLVSQLPSSAADDGGRGASNNNDTDLPSNMAPDNEVIDPMT